MGKTGIDKAMSPGSVRELTEQLKATHCIWHRFYNWMVKNFGKDLHGQWEYLVAVGANGKKYKYRHRSFNDLELSRRLVGYEAICKIEKYVKRHCPEIKIVRCDDGVHAGSDILLIPHPNHGITVIFIPQCTLIQNQFFLYKNHYSKLIGALKEMKDTYR